MNTDDFVNSPAGDLVVTVEGARAFVPRPLPRTVQLNAELIYLLDQASRAAATLGGVGENLANPHLLIAPFLRREAVLSSRIEGTQASITDLYLFEATGREEAPDAREVANYVRALERGRALLTELPICTRLITELHAILLDGVRGDDKSPGRLRDLQVWIGPRGTPIHDARFVPPPPNTLVSLLSDWEQFVHDEGLMPPLVRCALMHYQFETIHPFIDGNGRIGRLLIPLLLIEREVLQTPLLYLSAFFESRRQQYYDHLYQLSATGDWQPWLAFFLEGVIEQSEDALRRVRKLRDLHEAFRRRLQDAGGSANTLRLVDHLFRLPYVSRPSVENALGVTYAGAGIVVSRLEAAGILVALPETRPQLYRAPEILALLE